MKTKDLERKVGMGKVGYGQYRITIEYRGKEYNCHSNDSLSYDRLTEHRYGANPLQHNNGITYKQALQTLWDECKMKNNLDGYQQIVFVKSK